MKRLLFLIIFPLCAMSPKSTPRQKKFDRHVSFESDLNICPLPGQVQLCNDVDYLHAAYNQAREVINKQSIAIERLENSLSVYDQELHAYMIRTDNLVLRIKYLEQKASILPWYKRINCFRRK